MKETTHFIGIGGTGLSAIARVLVERGEQVTGSDREDSPLAAGLRKAGVKVTIGHAAANLNGATQVVRSSAIGDDNVEVQAARAKGLPVYKRVDFLDKLVANQQVIAVAGSHGKTTTTAMVAWMLTALNQKPGYIIGSVAANLGANAAAGAGRLFVIEADEYDNMFLGLKPKIAVVTNVEHDHPDLFPTPADFENAFQKFVDRIPSDGTLVACIDDAGATRLAEYAKAKGLKVISYAHSRQGSDFQITELKEIAGAGSTFVAQIGEQRVSITLQLPGVHNALNAMAALMVADLLGLKLDEAAMALSDFSGTVRRFDERIANGIVIVDDYAHHPTEIRNTLAAAKARFPVHRIIAVWQPHTFSRTTTLEKDFDTAFSAADRVLVLDVYASREKRPVGFDMSAKAKNIQNPDVSFSADFESAKTALLTDLKAGDVLIVMSAGDAVNLSEQIFQQLQKEEQSHA